MITIRSLFMTSVFDYILKITISSIKDQELKNMNINLHQANPRAKKQTHQSFHRETNNNMLITIMQKTKNVNSKLSLRKMNPICIIRLNLNLKTNPLPANLTLQVNSASKHRSSKWSLNPLNMAPESWGCKLKIYPRIKTTFNKNQLSRKINKKSLLHTFHLMVKIIILH